MAASASAIEAGKAIVRIFADDLGLKAGLKRASATLKSWAATTTSAGLALVGAGTSILAPLLLAGKQAAGFGDNLNDLSDKTGIVVGTLAELGYAAELSGTNLDGLAAGIKKMQVVIAGAAKGQKAAVASLAELGLTYADLANLTPDEQFRLIADRISQIQDPARRTAAAIKVLGKGALDLMPMMKDGAAGIAAMEAEANRLGITLAGTMASGVGDVDDLLTTLTSQLHAFKTVVGAIVSDALRPIIKWTQPIIGNAIRWMAANQGLVKTLLLIGTTLVGVGAFLVAAGVSTTVVLVALGQLATIAVVVGKVLGAAFAFMISPIGLAAGGVLGLIGLLSYLSGFGGTVLDHLGELWGNLKDTALSAWGGIIDAIEAGELQLAADIAFAALRVGWVSVVGFFKETWSGFKTMFLEVLNDIGYRMATAFEIAVDGIARAWATTINFMGDLWSGFRSLVRDGWEGTMNWMEDRWLDIIAKTTGTDRQALADQANKDRGQRDKNASDDQIGDQAKRDAAHAAQMEALKKAHEAQMGALEAQRKSASDNLQSKNAEAVAKAQREYEAKKAELDALREKAREKVEEKRWNDLHYPRKPGKPSVDMDGLNNMEDIVSRGTMSGFNFSSLNVSGISRSLDVLMERTADATERTADAVENLQPGIESE